MSRVLFFSGSVGLGHVTRDLAIAREMRRVAPGVEICWLAAPPATDVIAAAGETLLPEADACADVSAVMERVAARGRGVNLVDYLLGARAAWQSNVRAFRSAIVREQPSVVVGDETYEIALALKRRPSLKTFRFVMIYDFIGMSASTRRLRDRLIVYVMNRRWASDYGTTRDIKDLALFVGEPEDVPDEPFGRGLPNRRAYALSKCTFVGYVLPFGADEREALGDRAALRRRLGLGDGPLVVCSAGGTAAGRHLLELCLAAYPVARARLPGLRLLVVAGPRLAAASLPVPDGAEVRGYVPRLYEQLAACDLAIVEGGGTTTIELTALRRPFLFFPLEGHYEQEVLVAGRLARHRAGVRMPRSTTSPEALAAQIVAHLGERVECAEIPCDGAARAAERIARLL